MAIPERQLESWSKCFSINRAQYTHQILRKIIGSYNYTKNYKFEDYIHGSYASHTNIDGNTPVDIVVQLNSLFHWDVDNLSPEKLKLINEIYPNASYSLQDFKSEIIRALKDKFGNLIKIGNKSIKIFFKKGNKKTKANIVVALQHRLYVQNKGKNTTIDPKTGLYYYEGIWFKSLNGDELISFPKIHLKNGFDKNCKTNNKFKPTVRIFKNMRNKAVELKYLLSKEVAPSYFIECLLYNVPDYIFNGTFQEIVYKTLQWLKKELYKSDFSSIEKKFKSQNEIVPLFGEGNDKWNIFQARIFLDALLKMWENWHKGEQRKGNSKKILHKTNYNNGSNS